MYVPLRDGFLGRWEFLPADGEEGRVGMACLAPVPASASTCGREVWGPILLHMHLLKGVGELGPFASGP